LTEHDLFQMLMLLPFKTTTMTIVLVIKENKQQ